MYTARGTGRPAREEAPREKTEKNQASDVSVRERSRQHREGRVYVTQEVGGKLRKIKRQLCHIQLWKTTWCP